jgi:hypothetical protein
VIFRIDQEATELTMLRRRRDTTKVFIAILQQNRIS